MAIPPQTTAIDERLASLPPEKRALIAKRFAGRLAKASDSPVISRRSGDGPWPVSSSQHRLWFLDQLEQGNPAYNVYRAVRMRGVLDPALLARSLAEIVRRHEILRSTFPAPDGSPVQIIAPAGPVSMPIIDLTDLSTDRQEVEIESRTFAEAHRGFDLAHGPMLRATVLRLAPQDHLFLLTCHHIVADGWSVGILFRELTTLYEAFRAARPSPLPELPIQYADYAVWQQGWLESVAYQQQLAYWRERLGNPPPPLELPTDRPRAALTSTRGERCFFKLPKPLLDDLFALTRQVGPTSYMGLLAAFKALLHRITGATDIAVGSPVAGRNQDVTADLIGCFSNTLVLRTALSAGSTFRQLLEQVREVALGAYANQDIPFERLVRELRPRRDPSRMTFFQVNFRLVTAPAPPSALGPVALEFLEVDNRRAKFDLSVELWERPDALRGYFEYYTDLFDRSTIRSMIDQFEALLRAVVKHPDTPLTELELHSLPDPTIPRTSNANEQSGDTKVSRLRAVKRRAVGMLASNASTESPGTQSVNEHGAVRYRLRQATLKDADFLYRLRKQTLAQFATQFHDWTDEQREALYMDFDPAIHKIIVVDGHDAGAMGVRRSDREFYFANLHIFREFQGRWLGTWIFRDLIAEADACGVPIRLHVMKINPARRLYERMGFAISGETDIRYEMMRPCPTASTRIAKPAAVADDLPREPDSTPPASNGSGGLRLARRKSVTLLPANGSGRSLPEHDQPADERPHGAGRAEPRSNGTHHAGPPADHSEHHAAGSRTRAASDRASVSTIPAAKALSTSRSLLAKLSQQGIDCLGAEDPALYALLDAEYRRQSNTLAMVAASSVASPSVLACEAAVASNVTTEGYPGSRFHGGCGVVDQIEQLAIDRAKAAFGAQFANVQPHSGSSANEIVMFGLLNPGDTILGMDLNCGGHLTHGSRASISGRVFHAISYGLGTDGRIDYDAVGSLAREHRPRLIIAGASSYPRLIDFAQFRAIADDVGAYLLADISHIAGLVAAGLHPNPIDHAHFTTTSTYKQLYGPRGGLILIGKEFDQTAPDGKRSLSDLIQKTVFPYFQGTPNLSAIAAKARALATVATLEFRLLAERIVADASALSDCLMDLGYRVLTDGTDNHLMLIDILQNGVTGIIAERALEECGVIVNKNKIPGDKKPPSITSGLRLGTNTLALRGMTPGQMPQCAALIDRVLKALEVHGETDYMLDPDIRASVSEDVLQLCHDFPLPDYPVANAPRPQANNVRFVTTV